MLPEEMGVGVQQCLEGHRAVVNKWLVCRKKLAVEILGVERPGVSATSLVHFSCFCLIFSSLDLPICCTICFVLLPACHTKQTATWEALKKHVCVGTVEGAQESRVTHFSACQPQWTINRQLLGLKIWSEGRNAGIFPLLWFFFCLLACGTGSSLRGIWVEYGSGIVPG